MPSIGQVGGKCPPDATTEQKALAEALSLLHGKFKPSSLSTLGRRLHLSEASLSHYLNARRIPAVETIKRMYAEALADQGGFLPAMPFPQDKLLFLREAAKFGSWSECRVEGCPGGQLHRRGVPVDADRLDRHNATNVGGRDRHNSLVEVPPALHDALAFVEQGKLQDGLGLLWSAGGNWTAAEVAAAAGFCLSSGRADEAGALLRSAQRRAPAEILEVTKHLVAAGVHEGVELLLLTETTAS